MHISSPPGTMVDVGDETWWNHHMFGMGATNHHIRRSILEELVKKTHHDPYIIHIFLWNSQTAGFLEILKTMLFRMAYLGRPIAYLTSAQKVATDDTMNASQAGD